jgi:hypothetical protein
MRGRVGGELAKALVAPSEELCDIDWRSSILLAGCSEDRDLLVEARQTGTVVRGRPVGEVGRERRRAPVSSRQSRPRRVRA